MTAAEILDAAEALKNAAESDMRIARREGSVIITGTLRGNLEVSYNPGTKRYRIANINGGGVLEENATASVTTFVLSRTYVVAGRA